MVPLAQKSAMSIVRLFAVFNLAGHVVSFPDESLLSSDARWGLLSPRLMQLGTDGLSAL